MVLLSLVVVLLVGAVAALATGRLGGVSVAMPEAAHSTGHEVLGADEVTRGSLATVRFDRAARGYRMDQVDAVLDRLGEELARRDERLAELTRRFEGPPRWPVTEAVDDADAPPEDADAPPDDSGPSPGGGASD